VATTGEEAWSIRGLLARQKLLVLGVALVVALMVAMGLVAVFGPKAGAVTDASTCDQWGSSNQAQQATYASLYLREHGPVRGGGNTPTRIINAINYGCNQAFGSDVSESTTVLQAIRGTY
jgi:hypothetical protein